MSCEWWRLHKEKVIGFQTCGIIVVEEEDEKSDGQTDKQQNNSRAFILFCVHPAVQLSGS